MWFLSIIILIWVLQRLQSRLCMHFFTSSDWILIINYLLDQSTLSTNLVVNYVRVVYNLLRQVCAISTLHKFWYDTQLARHSRFIHQLEPLLRGWAVDAQVFNRDTNFSEVVIYNRVLVKTAKGDFVSQRINFKYEDLILPDWVFAPAVYGFGSLLLRLVLNNAEWVHLAEELCVSHNLSLFYSYL